MDNINDMRGKNVTSLFYDQSSPVNVDDKQKKEGKRILTLPQMTRNNTIDALEDQSKPQKKAKVEKKEYKMKKCDVDAMDLY